MRVLTVCILIVVGCHKETPDQQAAGGAVQVAATAAPSSWAEASTSTPLGEQLAATAAKAAKAGKTAIAYLHADWCEPCNAIAATREKDPAMKTAFATTQVLAIDIEKLDRKQLAAANLDVTAIPVFFKLDATGRVTGAKIDGGAWGENVPANMAPPLTAFFTSK